MDFYLNLADDHLKQHNDEGTIGLILCKTKDGLVAEYALRDGKKPIGIAEYTLSEMLPENIRGEMPTIEELEAEIEREYEALKSPAQKKIESLKEKLKELKVEEIKQEATLPILYHIIDKSLLPLYEAIINKMAEIRTWFYDEKFVWSALNNATTDISLLASELKNAFVNSAHQIQFNYRLNGFKKAGTEAFSSGFMLNFNRQPFWYGIVLINHNNNNPILKKLYHEQLTEADIAKITEIVFEFLLDDISREVERIKNNQGLV